MRSISLYCTEGSANKEYHTELVAKDGGFVVNFRYGARGKAMTPGTKTASPVSLELATKVYDKLVAEKMGKGYTPDVSGTAYTDTPNAERVSGWRPALLTPVDEDAVQALLDSGNWVGSEKKDGERRAVEVLAAQGVVGINRKGLYVGIPAGWADTLCALGEGTIVDGEHIGDELFIFDCPQLGSRDLRGLGYEQRHAAIATALGKVAGAAWAIKMIPASKDPAVKRAMLKSITAAHGEGIVLRQASGSYEAGLTAGSVKYKLYESATCIVLAVTPGKRSVSLGLLDALGAEVSVGSVTIPANHAVPLAGELSEVRYMHRFEGGSLYQPVYLGKRMDLDRSAATLSQVRRIKMKSDERDDAVALESTELTAEPSRRRMRP